MQSAAPVAGRASAHPADLRLGTVPGGGGAAAVGAGGFGVGVAVKLARTGQAGVGGASRGHRGVRKGTHASFVGDASEALEVFGEKHTKG
ncbi:hypothetical protein SVIO_078190 [Streptomyces violaceusniger]|uniref:Uncharacterized protein n=1 Tax=Streptomyces violaceusniger TaxID=68280 RepID=A0A4D4LDA6_STRVO|nr:hypothetical protein SVIO_078190 [Streptomyces violaceusniger]